MQNDANSDEKQTMRTTLTIDDQLFSTAVSFAPAGIEKSELIRECVKAFIQLHTSRRLAALGGQAPEMEVVPRRREEPAVP